MFFCRPFFRRIILHWHAAGLAKWLETSAQIRTRALTYRLFKPVDFSIVLSRYNFADAEKFLSRYIRVVPVGIPDPCPDFAEKILPLRRERIAARKKILAGEIPPDDPAKNVSVLFLAHCTREKGVFDSMAGVMLANEKMAAGKKPLRFRLTLIGAFASDAEEKELRRIHPAGTNLDKRVEDSRFRFRRTQGAGAADADIFCFPTFYLAENQPGNLIEAMAHGLPVVTTRWRSIPEMLPENYPGLVDPRSPEQIADALVNLAARDFSEPLREIFLRRFTLEQHLANMADAIHGVENKKKKKKKISREPKMIIGLLQLNPTIGDFAANRQKLLAGYEKAAALGAEFILAPEFFSAATRRAICCCAPISLTPIFPRWTKRQKMPAQSRCASDSLTKIRNVPDARCAMPPPFCKMEK